MTAPRSEHKDEALTAIASTHPWRRPSTWIALALLAASLGMIGFLDGLAHVARPRSAPEPARHRQCAGRVVCLRVIAVGRGDPGGPSPAQPDRLDVPGRGRRIHDQRLRQRVRRPQRLPWCGSAGIRPRRLGRGLVALPLIRPPGDLDPAALPRRSSARTSMARSWRGAPPSRSAHRSWPRRSSRTGRMGRMRPTGYGGILPNPIAVSGLLGDLATALSDLPVLLVFGLLAIASLALRFRRSRGIERQQLKWLLFAVGFLLATSVRRSSRRSVRSGTRSSSGLRRSLSPPPSPSCDTACTRSTGSSAGRSAMFW